MCADDFRLQEEACVSQFLVVGEGGVSGTWEWGSTQSNAGEDCDGKVACRSREEKLWVHIQRISERELCSEQGRGEKITQVGFCNPKKKNEESQPETTWLA